jgi:hypothetical protein
MLVGCGARSGLRGELEVRDGGMDSTTDPTDGAIRDVLRSPDLGPITAETISVRCTALGTIPPPRDEAESIAVLAGEWRFCRSTGPRAMIFGDPAHEGFIVTPGGRWQLLRMGDAGTVVLSNAPQDYGSLELIPSPSGQYPTFAFVRSNGMRMQLYVVRSPDDLGIVIGRIEQGSAETVYARVAYPP